MIEVKTHHRVIQTMANKNPISSTTQQFLDIYDITSDVVIMKDGSTSIILSVNAINFGLLAEEEQDAIIYSYAGLLNSLNYNIQIVITSQTKDVSNYVQKLEEKENETTDRKRKMQIHQYRQFVTDLIQDRNVLDKKFYVVIPANALEMGFLSAQSVLPGVKNPDISSIERSVILEKAKTILEPKRDHLVGQFARIGLYARQLTTQEIIQLYYNRYNPEASEGQKITDSRAYTTPIVEARIQGVTMTDMSQTNTQTPTAPAAAAQEGGNQPPTPTGPATQGTPMPGASTTPTTTPTPAAPTAPAAPGAEKPQMPADKAAEVISGGPAINPTAPAMPGASAAPAATPPPSMGGAASTTPAAPAVPDADAQAAIDSTLQEIGGKTPSVGATTPTTTPAPAMGGAAPSQTPTPAAGSTGVSVPPQSKVSVSGNGGTTDQAGGDQKANAALPPLPEI